MLSNAVIILFPTAEWSTSVRPTEGSYIFSHRLAAVVKLYLMFKSNVIKYYIYSYFLDKAEFNFLRERRKIILTVKSDHGYAT